MANNKKKFGLSTHGAQKQSEIYQERFKRLPLDWKVQMFAFLEEKVPELHYKNLMDVVENKEFMDSIHHSKKGDK